MPNAIDSMIDELSELDARVRRKGYVPGRKPYQYKIDMDILHEIQSRNAKKVSREDHSKAGKLGGKKSHGGGKRNFAPADERVVFKMSRTTRDIIMRCARNEGMYANEFLYAMALTLKKEPRFAHLFTAREEQQRQQNNE